MRAFVPFLSIFSQSPASPSCLPSRDLCHKYFPLSARSSWHTTNHRRLSTVVCCQPSEKNSQKKPVSDLAGEELFLFISDDLKLKNAAQCLREKMPSLTWNGLITMVEDPKIIVRWEGMGISYLEANNLKGAIRSLLRQKTGPKEPGIVHFNF